MPNNIAIHAAAQHVNISIEFREQAVQVVVEDDGRGFDVTSVVDSDNKERGFGLLGMQKRARTCRRHIPQTDLQPGNRRDTNCHYDANVWINR